MKLFFAWVLFGCCLMNAAAGMAAAPSTGMSLSQGGNAGAVATGGKTAQSASSPINNGPRVKPRYPVQAALPIQKRVPIQPRL